MKKRLGLILAGIALLIGAQVAFATVLFPGGGGVGSNATPGKGQVYAGNGTTVCYTSTSTDGFILSASSTAPCGVAWILNTGGGGGGSPTTTIAVGGATSTGPSFTFATSGPVTISASGTTITWGWTNPGFASSSVAISAGGILSGGGDLTASRTITLTTTTLYAQFSGTTPITFNSSTGAIGCATCVTTSRQVLSGGIISGGGDLSADRTLTLTTSTVYNQFSGTAPVAFSTSTGAISCPTCSTATGANPSVQVGTAAVNGASTNFMRADGAPAINQAATFSFSALGNTTSTGNITAATMIVSSSPPSANISVLRVGASDLNGGVASGTYIAIDSPSGSNANFITFGNNPAIMTTMFSVASSGAIKSNSVKSALELADSGGTLTAYAGTGPCAAGQAMTTISAVGAQTCAAFLNAVGTAGTDVNISGSTLNIPDASATARGLVNTTTQTFAGNKTFNGTLTTNGITNTGSVTSTNVNASATSSFLGNTGFGTTTPARFVHAYGDQSQGVGLFERFNASNNQAIGTFIIKGDTTGGLALDGFGPAFIFQMQDASGTNTQSGAIQNQSDGGGTTSTRMRFFTSNASGTATLFLLGDHNGNTSVPNQFTIGATTTLTKFGATNAPCLTIGDAAGDIATTTCPASLPLTLLTTTSTQASTTSGSYVSIATSTFSLATTTNVMATVAGTISAAGTANTCSISLFIDGVNQDAFGNGLSNSGVTLSSNMDASFNFISGSLASGSHTLNLEVKATGGVSPVCSPSISQFAVNTISGSQASALGGNGTAGYVPYWKDSLTLATSSIFYATSTGDVSVGSSTDLRAFSLFYGANNGGLAIENTNAAATANGLEVFSNAGTASFQLGYNNSTNEAYFFAEQGTTDFKFGTANTERARIKAGGDFLIGTSTDAGNKFTVAGNVNFTGIGTTTKSMVTVSDASGTLALSPLSWEYLGSCTITGSPAASCANLTVAAKDELMIIVRVIGYGGADIASLRFNADTGNNYNSRYLDSGASTVTTLTNVQTLTTNFGRLFGNTQTTGRNAEIICSNSATAEKLCTVNGISGVGSVSTVLNIQFGGFSWVNTAAQITSVQLITAGANTLSVGSAVMVYGRNFN